jgi:hypothetical protein
MKSILTLAVFLPALVFAQGLPIKDGSTGNLATVNASGQVSTAIGPTGTNAGQVAPVDERGNKLLFADDGRMDTGRDVPLFADRFVSTTIAAQNKWFQSLTNMTASNSGGALTLNASAITTINSYANFTTPQKFRNFVDGRIAFQSRVRPINLPQTNATVEVGLGNALTNAAPTDGAFFRWTASGAFDCVINRGGTETAVTMTAPVANVFSIISIKVNASAALCRVERPDLGTSVEAVLPLDNLAPGAFNESPGGFLRIYTGAVAPVQPPQLVVGSYEVVARVMDQVRSNDVTNGVQGHSTLFVPTTGGQAANFSNSSAPASATLANATAGYATLGGKYQFVAVAGAATDYALFGFQVPLSFRFVVTGIDISTCNTGAAVATTAHLFEWGLGAQSTAVSLGTTDSTGATPTTGPRRIALGFQTLPVGAAIGQCAPDLVRDFSRSPIVVDSNRYLHIILQMPVATATASQVIRGTVTVRGYFEH